MFFAAEVFTLYKTSWSCTIGQSTTIRHSTSWIFSFQLKLRAFIRRLQLIYMTKDRSSVGKSGNCKFYAYLMCPGRKDDIHSACGSCPGLTNHPGRLAMGCAVAVVQFAWSQHFNRDLHITQGIMRSSLLWHKKLNGKPFRGILMISYDSSICVIWSNKDLQFYYMLKLLHDWTRFPFGRTAGADKPSIPWLSRTLCGTKWVKPAPKTKKVFPMFFCFSFG